ncbi:unnamed protein product [Mortierella alpina]
MRVSRSALYACLGTLILVSISTPVQAIRQQQPADITPVNHKRDLIGHLIGSQPAPAPAPGGNTPPPPTSSAAPVSPSVIKTGLEPLPSLVGEVLNPLGGGSSSTTPPPAKKKTTTDPADGTGGASTPSEGASSDTKGNTDEALSPGLIVLLVIVLMAVVAAVLFSCYKVRQSKRRRHQSWDEDILKNHAGSVGYSEGGGYGMYVGGSKEKPDLWRKNLDLFHRE